MREHIYNSIIKNIYNILYDQQWVLKIYGCIEKSRIYLCDTPVCEVTNGWISKQLLMDFIPLAAIFVLNTGWLATGEPNGAFRLLTELASWLTDITASAG